MKFWNLNANISDIHFLSADFKLAIGTNKGQILLYKSNNPNVLLDELNFELLEEFDCIADPHNMKRGDIKEEEDRQAANLYKDKSHIVSVRFANPDYQKNVYYYTVESLQYIYLRNYIKQEVTTPKSLIKIYRWSKLSAFKVSPKAFPLTRSKIDNWSPVKVNFLLAFPEKSRWLHYYY